MAQGLPPGGQGYGPQPPQQYGPQGYGPPQPYGYGYGPPPPKSSAGVVLIIVAVCILPVIGILAVLGIYGTSRYLTAAKTAEAKNTIGSIARSAQAGYEKEQSSSPPHKLCPSAHPVPSEVPRGRKEIPDSAAMANDEGWKCLKFSIVDPIYYQYAYAAGSGYQGPSRGAPDPGKNGFEASAEGDLNNNGITSLFTVTGKVDSATQTLRIDSQIFIDKEFE